jgi:hypothetical protein
MDRKAQSGRLMLAGAAAALLFGALASVGAALSPLGPGAAAKQYPKGKVTICHRTHSKKHPFVTIRVSVRSLKAHLKHGDTVGPCSQQKLKKKKKKNKQAGVEHAKKTEHAHHGKGKSKQNVKGKSKPKSENAGGTKKPKNGAGKGKSGGHGKPDKAKHQGQQAQVQGKPEKAKQHGPKPEGSGKKK